MSICQKCLFSLESGLCFHNCHFSNCNLCLCCYEDRLVSGRFPFSCSCNGVLSVARELLRNYEPNEVYEKIIKSLKLHKELNWVPQRTANPGVQKLDTTGEITLKMEGKNKIVAQSPDCPNVLPQVLEMFLCHYAETQYASFIKPEGEKGEVFLFENPDFEKLMKIVNDFSKYAEKKGCNIRKVK